MHAGEGFIDAVLRGAAEEALQRLAPGAEIDDPRAGRIAEADGVARWIAAEHAWLAGLSARATPVRRIVNGRGAVVERLLHLRVAGEERQLPIAVAAEADPDGRLRAVRLYHSFWSIERRHRVRGRLLPAAGVPLAPPVDAYQRALAAGDVDGVLACYGRSATVREPAGEPWVHKGPRGLRRLYGAMLYDGGIPLEHARAVDDGEACAVEYTVVRWGRTELPPQAGVAVYERGSGGLLRATRIYDDVEPPRM